jgi:2-haloacid dehalogenase
MSYKYLLFDADGTLFDYERAEKAALASAFKLSGIKYSSQIQKAYQMINRQIWLDFEKGLVDKETLKTIRFERLLEQFGISADPEKLSQLYLDRLGECSFMLDGAIELCRQLAESHHMAIVTNGLARVQYPRINNSELADLFRHVFVSEDVGYQKPDPGFFDIVLQTMQIEDKCEALIIGDSISADILGGVQAGIDTCWYNPGHLENSTVQPTYEIDRHDELLTIV